MKKLFVFIVTVVLLVSCGSGGINEEKSENGVINTGSENNEIEVLSDVGEEAKKLELGKIEVEEVLMEEEIEIKEQERIDWEDEEIGEFTCESSDMGWEEFNNLEDAKLLEEKIEQFNVRINMGARLYGDALIEYCKTKDSMKYIFIIDGYLSSSYVFGRYDKELDILEHDNFKYKVFRRVGGRDEINLQLYPELGKYYSKYIKENKFKGFGKRNGNKISIVTIGRPVVNFYEEEEKKKLFTSDWRMKYCNNGLTPAGNRSICFAYVYYTYDFVENILTEDQVCTYYIDDAGYTKVLERCQVFEY